MNHSQFFSMIRKGLPGSTFVLHGEEEYVKAQALSMIERSIPEDLRPFNYAVMKQPAVKELSDCCETLPLFADKRYVICNELGEEPSKYKEIITSHPEETVLVIAFKGVLPKNNSVLKLASSMGNEVLFEKLTANECAKWAIKHANEAGVMLHPDTAQLFVRTVGEDMANLVSETDKLIAFVGEGNTVTKQDISVCIRASLDLKVYNMLDMFIFGKPADGIRALHSIMDEGEEAIGLASFLVTRFKVMLSARRGIDAGRGRREVVASMEGSSFANDRAYESAKRFTQDELLNLISRLSDTAFMRISGTMKDDKYLEMVLMETKWRQDPIQ